MPSKGVEEEGSGGLFQSQIRGTQPQQIVGDENCSSDDIKPQKDRRHRPDGQGDEAHKDRAKHHDVIDPAEPAAVLPRLNDFIDPFSHSTPTCRFFYHHSEK